MNPDELRQRAGLPPSTLTAADRASGRYAVISALVNVAMGLTALIAVAAVILLVLDVWLLPLRLPASLLAAWPAFALALLPGVVAGVASTTLGRLAFAAAVTAPRRAPAARWLRHRLDDLDGADVAILVPASKVPIVEGFYAPSERAIALGPSVQDARTYEAYGKVARQLGHALLIRGRRFLVVLPHLGSVAASCYGTGVALWIGAILVEVPALYPIARAALAVAVVAQLAAAAFELAVTFHVRRQIRDRRTVPRTDPPEEQLRALAAHLGRAAILHVARVLAYTTVLLLADRVAAAVPPDLLPPPAQPLTGVPAFAAVLAALACCAAASSTLLWRARVLALLPLSAAASLAAYVAAPLLAVLLWNQPALQAHRWAIALAVAYAWFLVSGVAALALGLGHVVLIKLRLLPRPLPDPAPSPPGSDHLLRSPTPRSPDELRRLAWGATLDWLLMLASAALPLPLALLALQQLL